MSDRSSVPSPGDMLSATVRLPQHVTYRVFPAETVVLNLETGKYHGIDPVGGRMLEVLEEVGNVRKSAALVSEEFDHPLDQVERDLCEFCIDLVERGLIEVRA